MTPKEHLYGALIAIRHDIEAWDAGDDSFEPAYGLCGLVNYATVGPDTSSDVSECLSEMMAQWSDGSGSPTLPVPADLDGCRRVSSAGHQYAITTGPQKWDPRTPYGRARRALLAWLIDQMEQEDLSV